MYSSKLFVLGNKNISKVSQVMQRERISRKNSKTHQRSTLQKTPRNQEQNFNDKMNELNQIHKTVKEDIKISQNMHKTPKNKVKDNFVNIQLR